MRRFGSGGPRGLLANAGALMASRIVIAVLGWAGTILITRTLSVDDFGRFTFVLGLLGIMSIVTDMGIGRVAVSGLLDDRPDRDRFAGSYILLRTTLGLLGYALALGFVLLAGYDDQVVLATAVAGVVVVLATPSNAYQTVFEAHRRLGAVAVVLVVSRMAQLAFIVALAVAGASLVEFTLPNVLAELIVLAALAPLAHRINPFRYRPDLRTWWALLKEAAPLSVGAALTTVYFRADAVMLSFLADFRAVGIYGVAYKFVELAHFLPSALGAAILPLLVTAWPDQLEQLRWTIRRGFTLAGLVGIGIVVPFVLFAPALIELLYGAEYAVGADAARIVLFSECLSFATQFAVVVLIAVARQRLYPLIALAGLLVNIGLNLVLIPRFSYTGAAVATLVTDVLVLAAILTDLRRTPGLRPVPRPPLLRLLAAAVLGLGAGWGAGFVAPWPVAAVACVLVLGAAIVLLRAAGPDGLRGLRHDRPPPDGPGPA